MKHTPFFSLILLLAGWLFFQAIPTAYVGEPENLVSDFTSSCDSLPLECILGTAVPLQPADTDGDGIANTAQAVIHVEDLVTAPAFDCPIR